MSDQPITPRDLAQLTMLTGRISEPQEKSLRRFPLIFFNEIKDCTVSYSIGVRKGDESYVVYTMHANEEANQQLQRRCQDLERAIHFLFWNDVVVEVILNDKSIYKTEAKNVERSDQN